MKNKRFHKQGIFSVLIVFSILFIELFNSNLVFADEISPGETPSPVASETPEGSAEEPTVEPIDEPTQTPSVSPTEIAETPVGTATATSEPTGTPAIVISTTPHA